MPEQAYVQLSQEAGGRSISLASGRATLGRQQDCGIRVNDLRVSRRHAELFRDPFQRWWIRDLGSRNGTKVNGKLVKEHPLQTGDVIGIETLQITFLEGATSGIWRRKKGGTGVSATLRESDPDSHIRSLGDIQPPKIDSEHLSRLTEFGTQLLHIEDQEQRVLKLCQLMVHPNFQGRCVVPLRVRRVSEGMEMPSPEMLCEPLYPSGAEQTQPYVSITALRVVQKTGNAVVASNVMQGTGVVSMSLAGEEIPTMSVIVCPLADDEDMMDVIYLTLPAEYGTGEWLAMVQLACEEYRQAQVAWDARKSAEQHAVIEKELERGRDIQQRLLPRNIQVPGMDIGIGFEPCRWVGGDYVDVVTTSDGRTLLVVADVCGKGLQAALVTSCLHTMVHTSVLPGFDLKDIVERLNAYLCQMLPDDSFVSMVAIVVNQEVGQLECINAGHPPALVLDKAGQSHELQVGVNPPLGLDPGEFVRQVSPIASGQMLALYTDGLTEIGPVGDLIGIEGVRRYIGEIYRQRPNESAQHLADQLRYALDDLEGNQMPQDDRTFLLARCQ